MRKEGFALKKVIIVLLIVLSIAGALLAAYAIKSPTNTKSQASTGCDLKPEMILDSTDKYETMAIYHLRLINNCPEENEFLVNIKSFPESPKKYDKWSWKFKNGEWNFPYRTEALSGTTDISLTIKAPLDNAGLPEKIQTGIYRFFVVETALADNPSLANELDLTYSVD